MFKRFFFLLICLAFTLLAAAQFSKRAVFYYETGMSQEAKGLYPEAILSFKQAVALNKNFDSAYAEMAGAYYKMNKVDTALILYKKAVTVNPRLSYAYISMANIYRDVKMQFDDAITAYLLALKNDSNNKVTYYSLAWCYNAKKEYEKAIPYAVKALEIDNNYRPPYGELAHAYRFSGKFAEGVAQFKKNLAISVNDLPLYYCGLCYLQLNEKAEASKMYDELVKINPKLGDALKKKIDAAQ